MSASVCMCPCLRVCVCLPTVGSAAPYYYMYYTYYYCALRAPPLPSVVREYGRSHNFSFNQNLRIYCTQTSRVPCEGASTAPAALVPDLRVNKAAGRLLKAAGALSAQQSCRPETSHAVRAVQQANLPRATHPYLSMLLHACMHVCMHS